MPQKARKPVPRKIVLRLPDLDHAKSSVVNSLSSPCSRRNYKFAMEQFITWYCSEPRLALNRTVVLRFRLHIELLGLAAGNGCSRQVNSISGLTVIRKSASRQRRHQILQVSALTISRSGLKTGPILSQARVAKF
jgi:hypothetical protein